MKKVFLKRSVSPLLNFSETSKDDVKANLSFVKPILDVFVSVVLLISAFTILLSFGIISPLGAAIIMTVSLLATGVAVLLVLIATSVHGRLDEFGVRDGMSPGMKDFGPARNCCREREDCCFNSDDCCWEAPVAQAADSAEEVRETEVIELVEEDAATEVVSTPTDSADVIVDDVEEYSEVQPKADSSSNKATE